MDYNSSGQKLFFVKGVIFMGGGEWGLIKGGGMVEAISVAYICLT
jgi:hypothetical protein